MRHQHLVTIPNDLFFDQLFFLLEEHNEVEFTLKGGSMSPFLREGDKITLGIVDRQALRCGQIVLAKWNNNYILHRVVKLREDLVLLAGDANIVQMESVSRKDILAIAIDAYRGGLQVPLNAARTLVLTKIWYYMRPLRRMLSILSRMTTIIRKHLLSRR